MTEFKTELDKFDPQIAELQKIADVSSKVLVTDLKDKKQLAFAKAKRIELKSLRVKIEKKGLELRNDANTFNKAVMKKQHEMLDIIVPEEERLSEIEAKAEKIAELEKRKEYLQERKEKLSGIGDSVTISDTDILEMDDVRFFTYFNERTADWNAEQVLKMEEEKEAEVARREEEARVLEEQKEEEIRKETERKEKEENERKAKEDEAQAKIDAENAKIEEAKRKLEEEKREIEHQKELDATRKKVEEEAEILVRLKTEKAKKEEEEREAIEVAKKEAEEKALVKRKAFQEFLTQYGYSEKTKTQFHMKDGGTRVTLYKIVGVFKK